MQECPQFVTLLNITLATEVVSPQSVIIFSLRTQTEIPAPSCWHILGAVLTSFLISVPRRATLLGTLLQHVLFADHTKLRLKQTLLIPTCSKPQTDITALCRRGLRFVRRTKYHLTHRLEPMDPRSSKPHTSVLKIQRLTSAAIFLKPWNRIIGGLGKSEEFSNVTFLTLRLYKVALILLLVHCTCRSYFLINDGKCLF